MEPDLEAVASTSYEGTADSLGRWSGRGRVSFKSGATYDGSWSAGQMHGQGNITFPDGISYEGEFRHNKLTGKGVYTWPSGACYEGQVVNGRREGRGRLSFTKSPAVYDGQWHDGLRHGHGVLYTNSARTSYYRGNWLNDTKHGPGVMKYDNGDVYDGMWENDKKKGLGTMRWSRSRQQYSGEWDNNVPNGAGLHVWYGEGEMGVPAHAQLLMYNRYYGHFKDGRRHGYGVLYYATGARYEGYWMGDQKHGPGCFVFENGEVWAGVFAQDRPLLAPGDAFAPASTGMVMQIEDLVEEEENPAFSRRAVSNLLLCYNTELRMLYDKYCKRPSHHLPGKLTRLSFSMRAAQLWDLVNDCRLLGAQLNHSTINGILATARLAPERLRHFRQQESPHSPASLSPEQRRFWDYLFNEHAPGGSHSPAADMTFRSFCEAIVRIAAVRFQHLPSLERRLHVTLTQHLLHLVNKAKATPPAPPAPLSVLPPNTSVEAAAAALGAVHERLAAAFLEAAGEPPPPSRAEVAAALAAPEARGGAAMVAGVMLDPVYGVTAPARALAAALTAAAGGGGGGGALGHPLSFSQALLQLLWSYVTRHAYGPVQR
ncbi:Cadherin member 2 [Pleodorina starrii]|nr:Cadherin member 2 [Pleodorina starrii]